jgi:hypothetical protein
LLILPSLAGFIGLITIIGGRLWPQIGDRQELLDLVTVNFYHNYEWIHGAPSLPLDHPLAEPLRGHSQTNCT